MAPLDFIEELRGDHRRVRDGLLELINSLDSEDLAGAGELFGELDSMVGPHFSFEEDYMYPALRPLLGDHLDRLIKEHGEVIGTRRYSSCVPAANRLRPISITI